MTLVLLAAGAAAAKQRGVHDDDVSSKQERFVFSAFVGGKPAAGAAGSLSVGWSCVSKIVEQPTSTSSRRAEQR